MPENNAQPEEEEEVKQMPPYPECLIPVVGFQNPMDLKEIYLQKHFYTQRKASCSQEECVNELGEVTEMALYDHTREPEKMGLDLIGMSVNMMGTPHLPEYGKWTQLNPASKYWDGKVVLLSKYEGKYDYNENQAFIYLNAHDLEGMNIPYEMKFSDRTSFDRYKDVAGVYGKAFSRTSEYPIKGIIRHIHKPTFLNYWHAEIWVKPDDLFVTKDLKDKPEWKLKLKNLFIERLRACAMPVLPDYNMIPETLYNSSRQEV